MDKKIFDKLVEQASEKILVGYEPYVLPPVPIYEKILNKEKFAELILQEAVYIGGGLVSEIKPSYNSLVTIHESVAWQGEMRRYFKIKA